LCRPHLTKDPAGSEGGKIFFWVVLFSGIYVFFVNYEHIQAALIFYRPPFKAAIVTSLYKQMLSRL